MSGPESIPARPVGSASLQPRLGFCADVGGSFIKFASVQPDGTCVEMEKCPTPSKDWAEFCAVLQTLCAGRDPRLALSLSIAGVVDPDAGLALSANIPCISGHRLGAELTAALGRPVLVANDADCFVLAEALRGAGAGRRIVFGIILGTGVGGGLVVEGRIIEGEGGITGEWGHGPILGSLRVGAAELPSMPCGCGQSGCLDTLGSARGLERIDTFLHGGSRDSLRIIEAWERAEAAASQTVSTWLGVVAGPLAMVLNLTGASIVPVGGGLSNSRALVDALDAAVRACVLRRSETAIVVPSELGADAGLLGAALRLVDRASTL
ncbi:ROK family protein [Lichenifustis flavocetrariae]|uniref:ROK family protein n=1 Tax=Lichenifustis flavocetrariae TaxID=2949735 RepID=A0AA41YXS3_9HYPH|nr:ROK family protein [Lichenifustis flavocetrariae]MCW6509157.1 ROK family protein [Lichenifustis flavocetrariae]